jgi:hypothetical protein
VIIAKKSITFDIKSMKCIVSREKLKWHFKGVMGVTYSFFYLKYNEAIIVLICIVKLLTIINNN